jgi:hypothetical protein
MQVEERSAREIRSAGRRRSSFNFSIEKVDRPSTSALKRPPFPTKVHPHPPSRFQCYARVCTRRSDANCCSFVLSFSCGYWPIRGGQGRITSDEMACSLLQVPSRKEGIKTFDCIQFRTILRTSADNKARDGEGEVDRSRDEENGMRRAG